jgi:2-phosphosulfolactate phosphatase
LTVPDPFGKGEFNVRLAWGPVGAQAVQAEVAVIVDVLSFSTSVTVACERGMRVFPYRWNGAQAEPFAAAHDAVLAVGRLEATKAGAMVAPSLSPASLQACEAATRLVLPSPNGSTIAAALHECGATVVAGCLRNARAVAQWLVRPIEDGRTVAVIAAGERWSSDDSLRPALEDHLGAGAILSGLVALGHGHRMSPEARAAAEMYDGGLDQLSARLYGCVSGRELVSRGFGADVDVAADLDASAIVPVLADGAFEPSPHVRP